MLCSLSLSHMELIITEICWTKLFPCKELVTGVGFCLCTMFHSMAHWISFKRVLCTLYQKVQYSSLGISIYLSWQGLVDANTRLNFFCIWFLVSLNDWHPGGCVEKHCVWGQMMILSAMSNVSPNLKTGYWTWVPLKVIVCGTIEKFFLLHQIWDSTLRNHLPSHHLNGCLNLLIHHLPLNFPQPYPYIMAYRLHRAIYLTGKNLLWVSCYISLVSQCLSAVLISC